MVIIGAAGRHHAYVCVSAMRSRFTGSSIMDHDSGSGRGCSWAQCWEQARTIALSSEVRALIHRIMDTDPVGALPKWMWNASPDLQRRLLRLFKVDAAVVYRPTRGAVAADLVYYGGAALVSSAKAERDLGFVPSVSRERAMALTLAWAHHARLVPAATDASQA